MLVINYVIIFFISLIIRRFRKSHISGKMKKFKYNDTNLTIDKKGLQDKAKSNGRISKYYVQMQVDIAIGHMILYLEISIANQP